MADLLNWAARSGTGATVELACPHGGPEVVPLAGGAVPVLLADCFDATPLALPLEILQRGVDRVVIRADSCPAAGAPAHWREIAEEFALPGLAVHDATPTDGEAVAAVGQNAMPTSRRGLLALLRPVAEPEDGPPAPAGTPHQRLRHALRELATTSASEAPSRPGPGLLLAAEGCDLAGVCVRVCPEDALTIRRSGRRATLSLEVAACSGCGACVVACPGQAIGSRGRATWRDLLGDEDLVLAEAVTGTCERCRATFPTRDGAELCPACDHRRANPFGSALPEEVRARLRGR